MATTRITFPKSSIKTAIISFGTRLCPYMADGKNVRHQEVFYLRHFLLNFKDRSQVDVLTKILDKDPETGYFKDIFTTDINQYDEIIIHNAPNENFFTGGVLDYWEATFNALLDFKKKDNIWFYLTDPKLSFTDLGAYIKKRSENPKFKPAGITTEKCDKFSKEVLPHIKLIFVGNNYPLLKERNPKEIFNEWDQLEVHEFWAANNIGDFPVAPFPREFDITYSGNNRASDRNKVLDGYFKNEAELKKLWRGYEVKYPNTTLELYTKYPEYLQSFTKSYASFVVGDFLHYQNIRSVRFFECLNSNAIAFIHAPYGENFIENDELKKYIVINNIKELKEKLDVYKKDENLFRKIITLQKQELNRICGKYKLSFKLQPEQKTQTQIIKKAKPLF